MNTESSNEGGLAMARGSSVLGSISGNDLSSLHGEDSSKHVDSSSDLVNSKSLSAKNSIGAQFKSKLKQVVNYEIASVIIAAIAIAIVASMLTGCGPNAKSLDGYSKALDQCKAEGKDAGSYASYELCAGKVDKEYGKK